MTNVSWFGHLGGGFRGQLRTAMCTIFYQRFKTYQTFAFDVACRSTQVHFSYLKKEGWEARKPFAQL